LPGFLKPSCTWVIDFHYQGHARRWFRVAAPDLDWQDLLQRELAALYGSQAQLMGVRHATLAEETQYLRGEEPKNLICPSGR
jgi:hypothetical protein